MCWEMQVSKDSGGSDLGMNSMLAKICGLNFGSQAKAAKSLLEKERDWSWATWMAMASMEWFEVLMV